MSRLGNRDIFGELSFILGRDRTATVQSMEACYVLHVPSEAFIKYMLKPLRRKLESTVAFLKSFSFFEDMR